jgi:alkylation response protein AidB-like acyl-CoA dehydrogenase
MNFDLTEEQRLLGETVERFVADRYDFESRNRFLKEPEGFSRQIWDELAELGLLALPFSEVDGGFGAGGVETMLVMEALGRGLVVEPYLSTVILCGGALKLAASPEQKAARLEGIITGSRLMALAHHEPHGPRALALPKRTRHAEDGQGFILDGVKSAVLNGGSADELIVSATGPAGPTLFLVDPKAAGVTVRSRPAYDGASVAEVALDGVRVAREAALGPVGGAEPVLRQVIQAGAAAVCAEAVGVMASTLDTTVDYLKTRKQFGVAIGSFQALQHRSVEMLIQLELARSMAMLAAMSLDLPDDAERARNIAAAKVQIGRSGRFIGQQAVQLHGAIGITAEYKVGHAFKRLTAIDTLFGDADHHLDALAAV